MADQAGSRPWHRSRGAEGGGPVLEGMFRPKLSKPRHAPEPEIALIYEDRQHTWHGRGRALGDPADAAPGNAGHHRTREGKGLGLVAYILRPKR
jgi:hypothetical protein